MLKLVIPALLVVSSHAHSAGADCEGIDSIDDAIECLQGEVKEADADMEKYIDAIKKRHAADRDAVQNPPASRAAIDLSQRLWLNARDSQCNTFGIYPRDEAKIAARYLSCRHKLTRERTHELWERYLRRSDGSPPDLPEPQR